MKENQDNNGPSFVAPLLVLTAGERWALTKAILHLRNTDSEELAADPEWTSEVEQSLETALAKLNPSHHDNPA